jgi:sialidase-1
MRTLSISLIAWAAMAAPSAAIAAPSIEKLDLFEAGKNGYALYRIPGLVVTANGAVLAYAEARKSDRGDWGTIDIMLRRSADGGKTWSPPRSIAAVEGPKQKNPVALAQGLASSTDVTYNNPAAIADRNGSVHFLFCLEYMRAFYMRSDNDGQTFSKPVEITAAIDRFRPEYAWKVLATGPAHGIQLKSGRLVVPIWLSTGTGGHAHRPSVTSTIYSDDHGKTWKRGDIAVPDTPEWVFPNETVIAELADGRVLLNVRSESKANRRLLTHSRDGATGWSTPKFSDQLLEPICMASMISMRAGGRDVLVFANPDNLERAAGPVEAGRPRDRKNLTIQLSYDGGATWPAKRSLEPGYSGYSDLAALRDGTILCLFERGGLGDNHFRSAYLTLAKFSLDWVTSK